MSLKLFIVGIVFAVIAGVCSQNQTISRGYGRDRSPNIVSAAATLGFSVASGLCFLGAGIVHKREKNENKSS